MFFSSLQSHLLYCGSFFDLRSGGGQIDWASVIREVSVSIYIPLLMLPFAYLFAFIAASESVLVSLKFLNQEMKNNVRLATFLGFRFSLRYAKCFHGQWRIDAAQSHNFQEVSALMQRYRRVVRQRAQANKDRERRIEQFTGVKGEGPHGRWLDRREFYETKEALKHIFNVQMAQFRNGGKGYLDDKLVLFQAGGFGELPDDPEIEILVREDRKAWCAWRRTVSGFYLGAGGTEDVEGIWRYASTEPPRTFPAADAQGWMDQRDGRESPDWAFSDGRYPDS